jgi:hypothetical protein
VSEGRSIVGVEQRFSGLSQLKTSLREPPGDGLRGCSNVAWLSLLYDSQMRGKPSPKCFPAFATHKP